MAEPAETPADDVLRIGRLLVKARKYADSDPETSLSLARKAAEAICQHMLREAPPTTRRHGLEQSRLDVMIQSLVQAKQIPQRIRVPLRTIQDYGNLGSHAQEDHQELTPESVAPCTLALMQVASWFYAEVVAVAPPDELARALRKQPSTTVTRGSGQASEAASIGATTRRVPSIAVLPFVNLRRVEEEDYFTDGLAEEILNVLSKIPGLRVSARSSAFSFKGKQATAEEIGQALKVETLLEGTVRTSGKATMRISASLVGVSGGFKLWSQSYDRSMDDIFAVQDDIAQSVVTELRASLFGGADENGGRSSVGMAVAAAAKGRSTNPEAHRLFMRARYLLERSNRPDTTKAIEHLKSAIKLDPTCALAKAELGRAFSAQANWGWTSSATGYARAREAVLDALSLEPDLAEGHAGLGWILLCHDWDWQGAERAYSRAREFAPGNVIVLEQSSTLAFNLGRLEDAIRLARTAVEQDTLSPSAHSWLGATYLAADRVDEALTSFTTAMELSPGRIGSHVGIANALLAQGRLEEALEHASAEPEEWMKLTTLSMIHHAAGRAQKSYEELEVLKSKYADIAAYQVVQAHAFRGEIDMAFEWLERAYARRDPGCTSAKSDIYLRPLRSDPRYRDFLDKMSL
jgi:TolB-like protein/tetratricopeptide (TPR) repeat protein